MARLRRSSKPTARPPIPEKFLHWGEPADQWYRPYTIPPGATQAEGEEIWLHEAAAAHRRRREAAKEWALANGYTDDEMRSARRRAYQARQERALAEAEGRQR